VLRRSPVLLGALVVYPIVFAVLVGLVVRFANDRPRVAFVDLDNLPEVLAVGGQKFNVANVIQQVNDRAELLPMTEEEANHGLETGEVLAAIVVPRGFAVRLRGMVEIPTLELKTARGGIAGRVDLQTQALVYRLNRLLSDAYIKANLDYVQLLLKGGQGSFLGNEFDVVGLEQAEEILAGIERKTRNADIAADARRLEVFVREARLALGASEESLRATANPIELQIDTEAGRTWLLSAQLQSYALALTLAFICVLLAAGAIAAERDENVIGRLARGLVRLLDLVVVKILLAATIAILLGLAIALFFGLISEAIDVPGGEPWERLPLLAVGLLLAGAAFGAFGVLLGVVAREARTAVLVAFLVVLPLIMLGLVPGESIGTVSWLARGFPFHHAVRFFESALYDLDPWETLGREAAWLLALGGVFATAARVGVRRLLT
jgi:hypothetical protein